MRKLKICGIDISVYKTRVKIFDRDGDLSDDQAILILEYLHDEGFLDSNANISCEIISED